MRGYGQYCPVALGAEVFAERWTPIVIRNLSLGCERFGEILEGAPGIPRSVLAQRLRRLERDGVLERRLSGSGTSYHLTDAGLGLADVCLALGDWGARWREVRPVDRDPYQVLWMLSRLIEPASLPRRRVVVRFDVRRGSGTERYWLVASREGNEVCLSNPGYDEDGVLATDADWLIRWHVGRVSLARAQRDGLITLTGPRWLFRTLSAWGRLSPFAETARERENATDDGD